MVKGCKYQYYIMFTTISPNKILGFTSLFYYYVYESIVELQKFRKNKCNVINQKFRSDTPFVVTKIMSELCLLSCQSTPIS